MAHEENAEGGRADHQWQGGAGDPGCSSYQRLLDTKAQYQTRVAIDRALEDMRKGLHRPVTNVFAAIRTKHGLHERWLDHLAAHRACMGRRAHLVVMPRDLPRRNNGSSQR